MSKNLKENIKSFMSSDKARLLFVIIGLGAIFLIFISNQFSSFDSKIEYAENLDSSAYCNDLSSRLVEMTQSIDGVGETKILLTLNSSFEYVYLDDDKTLTKVLEPEIRGVAVACKGGDNPVVCEKITQMLMTVLSLSAGDISVSKLS